jgi:histone H3/H4
LNNSRAIPGSGKQRYSIQSDIHLNFNLIILEALSEIKYYQRSTDLILPKATFQRVCREISTKISSSLRWQCSALEALQVAGEEIIVTLFECKVTNSGNGLNANDNRWSIGNDTS